MFISNIKTVFNEDVSVVNPEHPDRADLLQTIILVAGFAIVTIPFIAGIMVVMGDKGDGIVECIETECEGEGL